MTVVVADTSGLVSLGHAAGQDPDPVALLTGTYDVQIPSAVEQELRVTAGYADPAGQAAQAILAESGALTVQSVSLDSSFPLDDGENAAVTLANDLDADLFLCDEFNSLGLIHASLAGPRLVTTPTLLATFVHRNQCSVADAKALLSTISTARSWTTNSYVQRAHQLLDQL